MIDVLPGIGTREVTFPEMKEKISLVSPYVSWIHIDITDGTLVPNNTFHDFSLWKGLPSHLSFEAHLMVANPEKYIHELSAAGFKRIIAHVESQDPRRFLEEIEYDDVEVGLALDYPSAVEEIEPFLEQIDVALIMGYEAGISGQEFQPETLDKIRQITHHFPEVLLQVDGGVNEKTGPAIVEAGAKRLIATSFLFKNTNGGSIVNSLQLLRELDQKGGVL